jgi:hypothetical protein
MWVPFAVFNALINVRMDRVGRYYLHRPSAQLLK